MHVKPTNTTPEPNQTHTICPKRRHPR
jgi:hypothetical protein